MPPHTRPQRTSIMVSHTERVFGLFTAVRPSRLEIVPYVPSSLRGIDVTKVALNRCSRLSPLTAPTCAWALFGFCPIRSRGANGFALRERAHLWRNMWA